MEMEEERKNEIENMINELAEKLDKADKKDGAEDGGSDGGEPEAVRPFHRRGRPRKGDFTGRTSGILSSISTIVISLRKSNFMPPDTKVFGDSVEKLKAYLGVNEIQAVIFASLFTMYFDNTGRPVSYYTLADFYQCNPLIVMQSHGELELLVERGYIEECDPPDDVYSRPFYKIPAYVVDAVVANKTVPPRETQENLTIQTFIHQVEKLGDKRADSGAKIQTLYDSVKSKERAHKNVKTLANVKKLLPDIQDRTLLYDVAAGMINHINTEVDLMVLVNRNTDESAGRQALLSSFMDETHVLFAKELVQFENKASMMDSTVSLTDKAFELILGDEGKFYQKKVGDKQLKSPEKIQEKELFYMPENEAEVGKLTNSLMKDNLSALQQRLAERKLPKGICALFYGEPGTGKTETVYQMARKTGRAVFHVDIGNMRSQWYGETEQKFSKLFSDYRKMCESAEKGSGLFPILLFNEADAIFGKRVEIQSNGGGRVDNTIQNILLEEMERLPGILIATTNLEGNLDAAFERRFLFKVKFAKPNADVKSKIWKSNLGWLTDEQARKLALDFSFAGGEIANIVRKITMDEILTGKVPPFETVLEYCRTEKIQSGKATVGFKS